MPLSQRRFILALRSNWIPSSSAYELVGGYPVKWDASGNILWQWSTNQSQPNSLGITPDGTQAYVVMHNTTASRFFTVDPLTGNVLSQRAFGTQTIVIIEQYMWEGSFYNLNGSGSMNVSSDAVYLFDDYSEKYVNGSNPKPNQSPSYIAKLDLSGNQVWFRAYQTVSSSRCPVEQRTHGQRTCLLGAQNQLVMAYSAQLITFSTVDGSVM